jgi:hypothetical protein
MTVSETKDGKWQCDACKAKDKYKFMVERCTCWKDRKLKKDI